MVNWSRLAWKGTKAFVRASARNNVFTAQFTRGGGYHSRNWGGGSSTAHYDYSDWNLAESIIIGVIFLPFITIPILAVFAVIAIVAMILAILFALVGGIIEWSAKFGKVIHREILLARRNRRVAVMNARINAAPADIRQALAASLVAEYNAEMAKRRAGLD